MKKESSTYDTKKVLEDCMPSLIKLLGENNISWTQINYGLQKHIDKIRKEVSSAENKIVRKDTTFYSFVLGNSINRKETAAMFDFYECVFEQLLVRLTSTELNYLHKMIKYVLSNFDYRYINFIGELATLNAYMSTGQYSLLNIEERIYENNKVRADLFLKNKKDNREFLVEIVNIHIENKLLRDNNLESHLRNKIQDKINKTFYDAPKYDLHIQPVIWVDSLSQIEELAQLFENKWIKIENVFMPMCYLTFKLPDGSYEHRFEYVTTILNDDI